MSSKLRKHDVRLTAPVLPHRWGVAMVTYAGPHTGIDEATPAGDFIVQGLRHIGRQVRGVGTPWVRSTAIPTRKTTAWAGWATSAAAPTEYDLGVIETNARGLASVLQHELDRA